MTEPVEGKTGDTKEETFTIAKESNLFESIEDIAKELNYITPQEKLSISVSVDLLEDFDMKVELSEQIMDELLNYVRKINDPVTAQEFPYLITGTSFDNGGLNLNRLDKLHDEGATFANETLKMSSYDKALVAKLNEAKTRKDTQYILGHTHPLPFKETEENSTLLQISQELREKYKLDKLGLNLSLADLHQLVYLKRGVKGFLDENSGIYISVLTYEGDLHIVGIEDGKFKKQTVSLKQELQDRQNRTISSAG